jgi:hypothetical protein
MTNEISQVIKQSLFDNIDNTVEGVYDSNLDRTEICDTKWIKPLQIVTDSNGDEYRILTIEVDEWVTSEPVNPANQNNLTGTITIPAPYWVTGTMLSANREWTIADSNLLNKLPLVWLLEVLKMRKFGNESAIDFDAEVRLFFLDETNATEFYTADHRAQVMYPMEKLSEEFIRCVNNNRKFKTLEDYEIITFSRFGTERRDGIFQNILDANLSGVELRVRLIKFKANCNC